MKRVPLLLFLCILYAVSFSTITDAGVKSSAKKTVPARTAVQEETVKMAPAAVQNDAQPSSDRIMTVMIVVLISWIGIALYLFRIDRKVSALEKKLDE